MFAVAASNYGHKNNVQVHLDVSKLVAKLVQKSVIRQDSTDKYKICDSVKWTLFMGNICAALRYSDNTTRPANFTVLKIMIIIYSQKF